MANQSEFEIQLKNLHFHRNLIKTGAIDSVQQQPVNEPYPQLRHNIKMAGLSSGLHEEVNILPCLPWRNSGETYILM